MLHKKYPHQFITKTDVLPNSPNSHQIFWLHLSEILLLWPFKIVQSGHTSSLVKISSKKFYDIGRRPIISFFSLGRSIFIGEVSAGADHQQVHRRGHRLLRPWGRRHSRNHAQHPRSGHRQRHAAEPTCRVSKFWLKLFLMWSDEQSLEFDTHRLTHLE